MGDLSFPSWPYGSGSGGGSLSGLVQGNSSANATANSALINAALTAGGITQILTPGTYYVNSIILQPNSELYVAPGVTLKQFAGVSNTRMMTNNALVNGSSITVTSLTYNSTTGYCTCICSAAHGCAVGDFANVSWASQKGYNGNFMVLTVSTTNVANDTFTYLPYELPSATTATVFNQVVTANISAITRANPCVVTVNTVSTANPFLALQYVSFAGIGGMTQLNGARWGVSAIGGASGAWTLTLGNLETGVGLDSTGYTAYTAGGTATLLTKPLTAIGPRIYSADVTTIMVRKCDINIRARVDGILDQNNNSSYGDNYSSCLLLAFVQGGAVELADCRNYKGWALYTSGIGNFAIRVAESNASGQPIGGVQNVGWCRGVTYDRVALSNVVDNVFTVSNYDGAQYVWQNGITSGECDYNVIEAFSDAKVGVFNSVDQNIVPFLIFGVSNWPIDAKYGKLRCTQSNKVTTGFAITPDPVDTAGPWVRTLNAPDIHCAGPNMVNNVQLQGTLGNVTLGVILEGANLNFALVTGASIVADVINYTVNYLDPATLSGNAGYGLISFLNGGSLREFNLRGTGRLTSAIGNALITNAAKVGFVNFLQTDFENFVYSYTETTSASNFSTPYAYGMQLNFTNSFIGGLININNNAPRTVNLNGSLIYPSNYLFKHLANGALTINSGGNDWSNMAVGQFVDPSSNSGNIQVYGSDIFCDPGAVTNGSSPSGAGNRLISQSVAGQNCRSANAGANKAGFAACTGSAWYAMATGAAGINTAI